MAVINGALGKLENLFNFLTPLVEDEEDNNENRKRRKLSYDLVGQQNYVEENGSNQKPIARCKSTVQFPITFYNVDKQLLKESALLLDKYNEKQALTVEWCYTKLIDSTFASMKIISLESAEIVVEHECVVRAEQFKEDLTEACETETDLFVALVYASSTGLVTVSNIKIRSSANTFDRNQEPMNLHLDLAYSMDPAHKKKASKLICALSKKLKIKTLPASTHAKKQLGGIENIPSRSLNRSTKVENKFMGAKTRKEAGSAGITDINVKVENYKGSEASLASSTSMNTKAIPVYIQALNLIETVTTKTPQSEQSTIPIDNSVEQFYAFLQPEVSKMHLRQYTSPEVIATLTPFQTQNTQWMISREAHYVNGDGVVKANPFVYRELPLLYAGEHQTSTTGNYTNLMTDATSTDRKAISDLIDRSYRGGILADEMGLGKTISVLSLVAKHKYNPSDLYHPKEDDFPNLTVVRSTLIIAPGSIVNQWKSEIEKHAPSLKVLVYEGRRKDPTIQPYDFAEYDIVLTHYEAFTSEIHYTKPPPKRPRRSGVEYKREFMISPLVATLWFRCILDEAQMIEAPLTRVSSVAKLIPRWYSWAVTGTPMKRDFNDLYGLYDFLSLEETLNREKDFRLLCTDPRYRTIFYNFAKTTIRRNAKYMLENQIHIPEQHRHVVRIPFTQIEQHYYDDLWRACRTALRLEWLDSINWTLPPNASQQTINDFDAIQTRMRTWLLALRQNCVHPSIITNTSMKLSVSANVNNKKFQSLDEVLMDMGKSAKTALDDNQYSYYKMQLKYGGMFELLKQFDRAAKVYLKYIPSVQEIVKDNIKELADHCKLKNQEKGREYAEGTSSLVTLRDADNEEKEIKDDRVSVLLSQRLSKWRMLLHQYYFFLAGVYHAIENQEQEDYYYSEASAIRRQLLEPNALNVKTYTEEMLKAAARIEANDELKCGSRSISFDFLQKISYDDDEDSDDDEPFDIVKDQLKNDEPNNFREGSQRKADLNLLWNVKYIGGQLDDQLEKILFLRSKIIPILSKPLVDNDANDEVTGNEYEESLEQQELCEIYLSAYQNLLKDRRFIVKGIVAPLSDLSDSDWDNGEFVSERGRRIEANEKSFRKQIMFPGTFHIECLKDIEVSLRGLRRKIAEYPDMHEIEDLLKKEHDHIRSHIPLQTKLIDLLDTDFRRISQLFNGRIAYYKYLQAISDTLVEWNDPNPARQLSKIEIQSEKVLEMISQSRSRAMYFKTLIEEQKKLDTEVENKKPKDCLICQEPFEKGIITYCGHTSCVECGIRWFKSSKRCHTCNATVKMNEWYNISYKKIEMHNKEDINPVRSSCTSSSSLACINNVNTDNQVELHSLIQKIGRQKIVEGQGAKLDSILRHIKYIKVTTQGKCVVFSQWTKVLEMLSLGLKRNGIKYVQLNSGSSTNKNTVTKFQNDPDISVILLHARSQSSGLTLVAAQTVFIVEPVLNESMEKQAINRIHRIGQKKETNVFWYIVQDTIEERIQKIHDLRRDHSKDHYMNNNEHHQLSKLSDGGGEFVADDDLRRCFTCDESYALRL
ncbi:SNF2 family N-terminal domain-containing protein [Mycotypha africana]|uniref:SNF2 family N-terminal domain-containing protein n=1 Tax=Mycotypha africana TaxID=64632 RepID=UPI00230172FF|nr:SNF2 family N-terminal domain-containing protein [Mycotypha africana]KAI8971976.1 SNF2 family N-terminal domain-containing protein [Mycotypha africana]